MVLMIEQLTIFDMPEINDVTREALHLVATHILYASGHRGVIRKHLDAGDTQGAYDEFDKAYRTYGFGIDYGKYRFCSGVITYEGMNDFEVTSRELFNLLLDKGGGF